MLTTMMVNITRGYRLARLKRVIAISGEGFLRSLKVGYSKAYHPSMSAPTR
jgi:hypothetical protein